MPEFSVTVSSAERRRLEEFLTALRTQCIVKRNSDSWINTIEFENEFRSKLLTHHCFMGSPLFQESFDAAFFGACSVAGFKINKAPEGNRFWDFCVNGKKISLKTTKAKNLRYDTLHISKLTEAAWIQDCWDAKTCRDHSIRLFDDYCRMVDSIFQLRFFSNSGLYELVEVPVALFKQITSVPLVRFKDDGPTINIPIGKEPPDFTLKIDRSDAKITIANINKELCCVHGNWQILQTN